MENDIPSSAQVRQWLAPLSVQQLRRLSEVSGVPLTTLWNIRAGHTKDPRLETVRQIAPHAIAAAEQGGA